MIRYPPSVAMLFALTLPALIAACNHPLEIVGEGDITARGTGGSSCTLEASPCPNYIVHDYNTTYTAIPRDNYGFLKWGMCPSPNGNLRQFCRAVYRRQNLPTPGDSL